jgi:hypothetical protein
MADFKADHLAIKITQLVKQCPWSTQVVMTESDSWHMFSGSRPMEQGWHFSSKWECRKHSDRDWY